MKNRTIRRCDGTAGQDGYFEVVDNGTVVFDGFEYKCREWARENPVEGFTPTPQDLREFRRLRNYYRGMFTAGRSDDSFVVWIERMLTYEAWDGDATEYDHEVAEAER